MTKRKALKSCLNWFRGFFEEGSRQSMTRLISFIIALNGTIYLLNKWDFVGAIAIFGAAGAVKITGKKLTEVKR